MVRDILNCKSKIYLGSVWPVRRLVLSSLRGSWSCLLALLLRQYPAEVPTWFIRRSVYSTHGNTSSPQPRLSSENCLAWFFVVLFPAFMEFHFFVCANQYLGKDLRESQNSSRYSALNSLAASVSLKSKRLASVWVPLLRAAAWRLGPARKMAEL